MTANLIAFFWGLAEATLFFIVPDVALSVVALKGVDIGLVACLYAMGGALVGGTIMYYWGRTNIEKVTNILIMIPAIRPKDIEKVSSDLQKSGIISKNGGSVTHPHDQPRLSSRARFDTRMDIGGIWFVSATRSRI